MWFFFIRFFSWWTFEPGEPEPREETAGKEEFVSLIDDFVHSANWWNFHSKKAALIDDIEALFAPEDAEIRDAFVAEVEGIIGSKWNFLWNRHEVADELEQAVWDLTDPGGPLNPDDNECPEGDPETTVQINLSAEDDFYTVPDNASGTIAGNQGDDLIIGAGYDDYLAGNGGEDDIQGRCGDDTISGGRGNDTIDGGLGDDVIRGAFGSDTITGGDGADTFSQQQRTLEEDQFDFVTDFDRSEGDVFDLNDIDATLVSVAQAGDDSEILVDGDVVFLVADAAAADVEASIVYSGLA